jgi:hypothetical protein
MSIAFRQQNVIFRFPDPFIIYRYNCSLSVPEVGTIVIHPGQLTHFHKYKPVTSGEVFVLTRYYNTESRQLKLKMVGKSELSKTSHATSIATSFRNFWNQVKQPLCCSCNSKCKQTKANDGSKTTRTFFRPLQKLNEMFKNSAKKDMILIISKQM